MNMIEYVPLTDWDPLSTDSSDPGLLIAAKKREISNILKSYTGYYDLFSELIQNALDAVEKRSKEKNSENYQPTIWITIDMQESIVSVTDNGCGMSQTQFEQFLQPNFFSKMVQQAEATRVSGQPIWPMVLTTLKSPQN